MDKTLIQAATASFFERCELHKSIGIPAYIVAQLDCLKSLPGYWYCDATEYYLPPGFVDCEAKA